MKHRRHRPKRQRAGCRCAGKAAKVWGTRNRKDARARDLQAGHVRDVRVAITAQEQGA